MSEVLEMPDRTSARGKLAAEVRAEAARAGISQNKLAHLTGISQSTINRKFKGQKPFDIDDLEKIANVLGITVAHFFGVVDKNPRPDGPDGGVVPPVGLEPTTCGLKVRSSTN